MNSRSSITSRIKPSTFLKSALRFAEPPQVRAGERSDGAPQPPRK